MIATIDLWTIVSAVPPGVWVAMVLVFVGYIVFLDLSSRRKSGSKLAASEREGSRVWADMRYLRSKGFIATGDDSKRPTLGFLDGQRIWGTTLSSVLVMAPSGSRKTAAVVVPVVLGHKGPAVVASVKLDALVLTRDWRSKQGPVWVFDPSQSGGETARWSPLSMVHEWADALKAAKWLQNSSKVNKGGEEARAFWDANARKVLAPLLMLAADQGLTMRHVTRWAAQVSTLEQHLAEAIQGLGIPSAYDYWISYTTLADKTKSSVNGTLFEVLEAWDHPEVAQAIDVTADDAEVLEIETLLDQQGTLYLVAPASEQELFTPVFETLVNAILMEVEHRSAANQGLPIDPPLLLCLDEAANIAPLRNLHQVASKGRGEGVLLVSVWQDGGQVVRIYGRDAARTVWSNHVNKMFLSGISDLDTLDELSRLVGKDSVERASVSTDGTSRVQTSYRYEDITVAPPEWLRQIDTDEAVVISSNVKPMRLQLRPWYSDTDQRAKIPVDVQTRFDSFFASALVPRRRRSR